MQVQIQQNSLSILLDIISRFLTKVLAQDNKYSYYLKQWTSFRKLLSNSPLDLTSVLSHLSDLNHSSPQSARPSPFEEENFAALSRQQLSIDTNRNLLKEFDTKNLLKQLEITSPVLESFSLRNEKSPFATLGNVFSTTNSPELKRYRSEKYFENAGIDNEVSLQKRLSENKSSPSGEMFEQKRFYSPGRQDFSPVKRQSENYSIFRHEGAGSGSKNNGIKHEISFLTQRAKRLKDNMDYHTSDIVSVVQGKKKMDPKVWQQRSELRKIKYYAKGNWL